MDIQAAEFRQVENRLFQNLAEGNHHDDVRGFRLEQFEELRFIDRPDPSAFDLMGVTPFTDGSRSQGHLAPCRLIRLRDDSAHLYFRVQAERLQHGNCKCARSEKENFHLFVFHHSC